LFWVAREPPHGLPAAIRELPRKKALKNLSLKLQQLGHASSDDAPRRPGDEKQDDICFAEV